MFSRYILGNPLFLFRVWSWFAEQSQWSLTDRFQRLSDPGGYRATQLRLTLRKLLWRAGLDGTLLIKRGMDVLGAGAGLLILSPLFAITAAAIVVEDKGPVFFTQKVVFPFVKSCGSRSHVFPVIAIFSYPHKSDG